MTIDFKKTFKGFYSAKTDQFTVVKLPSMNYLMVDGAGDPNTSPEYVEAIEALYSVSYALKFYSKNELAKDYVVPPLEGLWWADDMNTFITREKNAWQYTMMIMVPDWLTKAEVASAIDMVSSKKPGIHVERLRLAKLAEGLCVQTLHIGPYDDEGPVLAKLHSEWMPANGYEPTLKHHEIYLGDPRKTAPAKLKTILRQPIRKR